MDTWPGHHWYLVPAFLTIWTVMGHIVTNHQISVEYHCTRVTEARIKYEYRVKITLSCCLYRELLHKKRGSGVSEQV